MKKSEVENKEILGSIQGLSGSVQEISGSVQELFGAVQEVAEAISVLASDVDNRFNAVDGRLDKLEKGQQNIFLRLDRVVYRSELRPLVKEIIASQA